MLFLISYVHKWFKGKVFFRANWHHKLGITAGDHISIQNFDQLYRNTNCWPAESLVPDCNCFKSSLCSGIDDFFWLLDLRDLLLSVGIAVAVIAFPSSSHCPSCSQSSAGRYISPTLVWWAQLSANLICARREKSNRARHWLVQPLCPPYGRRASAVGTLTPSRSCQVTAPVASFCHLPKESQMLQNDKAGTLDQGPFYRTREWKAMVWHLIDPPCLALSEQFHLEEGSPPEPPVKPVESGVRWRTFALHRFWQGCAISVSDWFQSCSVGIGFLRRNETQICCETLTFRVIPHITCQSQKTLHGENPSVIGYTRPLQLNPRLAAALRESY